MARAKRPEAPAGLTDRHSTSVGFADTAPSGPNGSSMETSSNRPARLRRSKQEASPNAVIRAGRSSSRAGSAAYSAIRADLDAAGFRAENAVPLRPVRSIHRSDLAATTFPIPDQAGIIKVPTRQGWVIGIVLAMKASVSLRGQP